MLQPLVVEIRLQLAEAVLREEQPQLRLRVLAVLRRRRSRRRRLHVNAVSEVFACSSGSSSALAGYSLRVLS